MGNQQIRPLETVSLEERKTQIQMGIFKCMIGGAFGGAFFSSVLFRHSRFRLLMLPLWVGVGIGYGFFMNGKEYSELKYRVN
mmetsp:Transcript_1773/g.1562  ORF Transcript_1773/g.1562 Transcript_1773/m.1562 type:complete len:82 (+) Transcript_1773:59-304(+)